MKLLVVVLLVARAQGLKCSTNATQLTWYRDVPADQFGEDYADEVLSKIKALVQHCEHRANLDEIRFYGHASDTYVCCAKKSHRSELISLGMLID